MKKNKKNNELNRTLILFVMSCILIASLIVILTAVIIYAVGVNFYKVDALGYLVTAFLLSLCISVIIASILSKFVTKYIDRIRLSLNKVANGDFDATLQKTKSKYFNEIIDDFNKMVTDLSSVPMLRNDFISNISHELKTPLSSIKGFAELIQSKKDLSEEEKQEYCKIIIEECTRLSSLSSDTLLISKLDTQTKLTNIKKIYIDEQIDECLFQLERQIKEKEIILDTNLPQTIIYSDPYLTKQIWLNILTNAIKFTKDKIKIDILEDSEDIIVEITDNGVGIPKENLPLVFEKFYQADSSRASEGTGLGLPICKRIIDLHKGNIKIETKENKYTKVIISLPKQLNEDID